VALDRIGPQLGIEISREGLIRLARLLAGQQPVNLVYGSEVDTNLRRMFGLDPEPGFNGPIFKGEELELEPPDGQSTLEPERPVVETLISLLISKAWAQKSKRTDSLAEIRTWLASRHNLETYLKQIKILLQNSAEKVLGKRKSFKGYAKMLPRMVLATAWQESCLRQFVVKKKKIVYLRSYNGSSVGVMQINERVWRGMYDLHRLRWNIRYNAWAGCEILDLYVTKYIEKISKKLRVVGKLATKHSTGFYMRCTMGDLRNSKNSSAVRKKEIFIKAMNCFLKNLTG
jgi:hypothetical protein